MMHALHNRGRTLDRLLLVAGLALLVLAGLCWGAAQTPLGAAASGNAGDGLGGTAVVLALVALVMLLVDALRATRRALWPDREAGPDGLLVTGLSMFAVAGLCLAAAHSPLSSAKAGEAGLGWLLGALIFAGMGMAVLIADALRVGWREVRHHGGHGRPERPMGRHTRGRGRHS